MMLAFPRQRHPELVDCEAGLVLLTTDPLTRWRCC